MRARWVGIGGWVVIAFVSCAARPPPVCECPRGCCDERGVCQLGNLSDACGSGGAGCVSCVEPETCNYSRYSNLHSCGVATPPSCGGCPLEYCVISPAGALCNAPRPYGDWDGGAVVCGSTRSITSVSQMDVVGVESAASVRSVRFSLEPALTDGGLFLEQSSYFDPSSTAPPVAVSFGVTSWTLAHTTVGSGFVTAVGGCSGQYCQRRYLAQGGQALYEFVGGADGGRLKGHASNVHLVSWSYQQGTDSTGLPVQDHPTSNADCIDIAEVDYDLRYWMTPSQQLVFEACDGGC